jgi:hypothetical protein
MKQLMKRKKILLALLLVFLAPGALAILFYMNPSWLGGLPTNKGQLIRPAIQLDGLVNPKTADMWHLVVWCPAGCDTACLNTVDDMARVRLALGRRLYQVDVWMFQPETGAMCAKNIVGALTEAAVKTQVLSASEQEAVSILKTQTASKIFLADPSQYVVLEYAAKGEKQGVFQDLKRLMNTREQA